MRRRIVAATMAGAAGIAIGLLPVASASASVVAGSGGGNGGYDCYRYPSNRSDARWDYCCNRDWRDRPSWCWDNAGVGGDRGYWRDSNWRDSDRRHHNWH
ncbi:hypothetical protein, partial [Streptomyces erythrochromogenes]